MDYNGWPILHKRHRMARGVAVCWRNVDNYALGLSFWRYRLRGWVCTNLSDGECVMIGGLSPWQVCLEVPSPKFIRSLLSVKKEDLFSSLLSVILHFQKLKRGTGLAMRAETLAPKWAIWLWMYIRNVRLVHRPDFIFVMRSQPINFIAIVPLACNECDPTSPVLIPCQGRRNTGHHQF